jgi:hemolysin III
MRSLRLWRRSLADDIGMNNCLIAYKSAARGAVIGYGGRVFGGTPHDERPMLRGWLHASAFIVAIPAGVALIVAANGPGATAAASVYVATLLMLFGTSAGYHLLARSLRARSIMQRLDHSMIYLLITGTYVPMCVVTLPPAWGVPLLVVVGACAVAGVVLKLTSFRIAWIGYALYPVMGWASLAVAPAFARYMTPGQLALLIGGGVAYTVGFPVLMLRRPDPWPRAFGYHEVWHGFTVVAAVLHFAVIATVVS